MIYEGKTIALKDGRVCLLRAPRVEDAAEMNIYLKTLATETHFISRVPEECNATTEQEEKYLSGLLESPSAMMIVAQVDGEIAGNCQINFKTKVMDRHRAIVGIGLYQKFWGLGIGTAMLRELIDAARAHGTMQLELEFVEGNARARALYEKVGFRVVAEHPNAVRLPDGTLLKLFHMVLPL